MKFEKVSFEQYFKDICKEIPYNTLDEASREEIRKDAEFEWESIKIPVRATPGSAAYDFFSPFPFSLSPGITITVPTGIKVQLDSDKFLLMAPRSGSGFKYGIQLVNTIGVIDCDFYNNEGNEGHIFAKLRNNGLSDDWVVETGDAIIQGIILPYFTVDDDVPRLPKRVGGRGSTSK